MDGLKQVHDLEKETLSPNGFSKFDNMVEDVDLKQIFEPFIQLSKGSLVMFDFEKYKNKKNRTKLKIIHFLLLLLALLPMLVYNFHQWTVLEYAEFFTFNWAWIYIFAFIVMQGIFSLCVLYKKNTKEFFRRYVEKLELVVENQMDVFMSKLFKVRVFMWLFTVFFFFSIFCFCIENTIEHKTYISKLNGSNITNSTINFRLSALGNQNFFFIDALVFFYSTYTTILSLVFMIISYKPIFELYKKFNADLKDALESQENDPAYILMDYEPHLMGLLDLIKFNNKSWSNLASHTFMVGFINTMMASFLMRSFITDASIPTEAMIYTYMFLSVMFLVVSTKYPSALYSKVLETQDIILSNKILARKENDSLCSSVDIFIKRLKNPQLSMYFFGMFQMTGKVMAYSMFILWGLAEVFHAHKKNE